MAKSGESGGKINDAKAETLSRSPQCDEPPPKPKPPQPQPQPPKPPNGPKEK